MTETVGQALEQALAYHRAPGMLPAAHGRPLPEGMITLVRLAGGDQALTTQCAESCGEPESEVVAAAVFFIQQVMFANGSDSYRVLGVNPEAPDVRIKEHYRWLVRWLHPDRNTDDWDSVYADRVNVAWQTLRLPDRRREYDLSRVDDVPVIDDFVRPRAAPVRLARHEPALLSSSTVQRLPMLVLGGLGGLAVVVLSLMWLGADEGGRSPGQNVAMAPVELPAALEPALRDRQVVLRDDEPVAQPEPTTARDTLPSTPPALVRAPAPYTAPSPAPAMIKPAIATSLPVAEVVAPRPSAAQPPSQVPALPRSSPAVERPASTPTRVAQSRPMPEPVPQPVVPAAPREAAFVASATAPATAVDPTDPSQDLRIQEAQAYELLREFGRAYQSGDINVLMRLFTADARNNRGGREAIVYDYQSLFSGTESRQLDLTPTGWILREEGGTLLASYRARVRSSGRLRAEVSEGTIRFDLRMVDGRARISQVRHNDGA